MQEIFKMLPYVVTIIVLIVVSVRKKREGQGPAALAPVILPRRTLIKCNSGTYLTGFTVRYVFIFIILR